MPCCVLLLIVALVVACHNSDAVAVIASRRGGAWGRANSDNINLFPLNDYAQFSFLPRLQPISPAWMMHTQSRGSKRQIPLDEAIPESDYAQSPSLTTSMPASLPSLHVGKLTTTHMPSVQPPTAFKISEGLNPGVVLKPGQTITPHTTSTPKPPKQAQVIVTTLRPAIEVMEPIGGLRPGAAGVAGPVSVDDGSNPTTSGGPKSESWPMPNMPWKQPKPKLPWEQSQVSTPPQPPEANIPKITLNYDDLNKEVNDLAHDTEKLQSALIEKNEQILHMEAALQNLSATYTHEKLQLARASQDYEQAKLEFKKSQGVLRQREQLYDSEREKEKSKLKTQLSNVLASIKHQEVRSTENGVMWSHIQVLKDSISKFMQRNSLEAGEMEREYQTLTRQVAERDSEIQELSKNVEDAKALENEQRATMGPMLKELAATKTTIEQQDSHEASYGELKKQLEVARAKLVDPAGLEKEIEPLQEQVRVIREVLEQSPPESKTSRPVRKKPQNKSQEQEVAELKNTLETTKLALKQLIDSRKDYTDQLQNENQGLQSTVHALTEERNTLQQSINSLQNDINKLVGVSTPQ